MMIRPYSSFNFRFDPFYNGNFGSLNEDEFLRIFWIIFVAICSVACVIALVRYVFQSIGLYSMAKHRGIKAPGLAWVPFANVYLMGKLSDGISWQNGKRTHKRISLLIITVLFCAAVAVMMIYLPDLIGYLTWISNFNVNTDPGIMQQSLVILLMLLAADLVILAIEVLYLVFLMRTLYIIFKDTVPQSAAGLIVLCIFVSPAVGPVLFAVRNKPSQAVIRAQNYAEQRRIQAEWAAKQQAQNPPPQTPEE